MDYQGSVYYYDGYSNFIKGKSQFQGENLEPDSGARRDWFVGYRHAMADHHCRVKRELDNVAHQFDSSSQQFESLATKKDEEWSGVGLPPVGCECEAKMPRLDSPLWGWRRVKVVISGMVKAENECLVYDLETTRPAWADEFRPIRTEADSQREIAIRQMLDCSAVLVEPTAGLIYDAIAAGGIRGIKLESLHE